MNTLRRVGVGSQTVVIGSTTVFIYFELIGMKSNFKAIC